MSETWLREGIEKIEELAKTEIIAVDGRKYSTAGLNKILEPTPASIKVKTLTGVVKVEEVILSPIVNLAPFRTFAEVDQPISKFLFRMRREGNHVSAALFEADGGAWRLEAMKNIAEYLGFNLPKDVVVIA